MELVEEALRELEEFGIDRIEILDVERVSEVWPDGPAFKATACIGDKCCEIFLDKPITGVLRLSDLASMSDSHTQTILCLATAIRSGSCRLLCDASHVNRCVKLLSSKAFGSNGPVMVLGYSPMLVDELSKFFDELIVVDPEMRGHGRNGVLVLDYDEGLREIGKARLVIIGPQALRHKQLLELAEEAKRVGKHIIMFGPCMQRIANLLGAGFHCPFTIARLGPTVRAV